MASLFLKLVHAPSSSSLLADYQRSSPTPAPALDYVSLALANRQHSSWPSLDPPDTPTPVAEERAAAERVELSSYVLDDYAASFESWSAIRSAHDDDASSISLDRLPDLPPSPESRPALQRDLSPTARPAHSSESEVASFQWPEAKSKAKPAHDKISALRGRVMPQRIRLHEKRGELRQMRGLATGADLKFMDLLRRLISTEQEPYTKPALQPVIAAGEASLRLRDELAPLEDDYDNQEKLLDQEDYELVELERSFYTPSPGGEKAADETSRDGNLSRRISADWPSNYSQRSYPDTSEGPPAPIGIKDQYQIKIGVANYLKERVQELIFERAQYLEDRKIRQSLNAPLSIGNEGFLAEYPTRYAIALNDLSVCEAEIERLRQRCVEEGVFAEDEDEDEYVPIALLFQPDPHTPHFKQPDESSGVSPPPGPDEAEPRVEIAPGNLGQTEAKPYVTVQDGVEGGEAGAGEDRLDPGQVTEATNGGSTQFEAAPEESSLFPAWRAPSVTSDLSSCRATPATLSPCLDSVYLDNIAPILTNSMALEPLTRPASKISVEMDADSSCLRIREASFSPSLAIPSVAKCEQIKSPIPCTIRRYPSVNSSAVRGAIGPDIARLEPGESPPPTNQDLEPHNLDRATEEQAGVVETLALQNSEPGQRQSSPPMLYVSDDDDDWVDVDISPEASELALLAAVQEDTLKVFSGNVADINDFSKKYSDSLNSPETEGSNAVVKPPPLAEPDDVQKLVSLGTTIKPASKGSKVEKAELEAANILIRILTASYGGYHTGVKLILLLLAISPKRFTNHGTMLRADSHRKLARLLAKHTNIASAFALFRSRSKQPVPRALKMLPIKHKKSEIPPPSKRQAVARL